MNNCAHCDLLTFLITHKCLIKKKTATITSGFTYAEKLAGGFEWMPSEDRPTRFGLSRTFSLPKASQWGQTPESTQTRREY